MRRLFFLLALLLLRLGDGSKGELLQLSLSPEFESYPCGRQRINAVLSVEAATELEEKPGVSLTSVIDKSGSMAGENMQLLIRTNQFLVDQLVTETGENSLGFVTYSTYVTEPLPLNRLFEKDVGTVKQVLGGTTARGSTNLSGGLMRGLEQQRDAPRDGPEVKAVFMFTDGKPTMGISSPEELKRDVQVFLDGVDEPIVVYSFGFGDDLNFEMLVNVAEAGNGLPYIISKKEDIPGAFGDALGGLLSTVAIDLNVTLVPLNGVEIIRVQSGGRGQADVGNGVQVLLGDMFLEERRDLLVELDVPDGCASLDVLSARGGFLTTATSGRVSTGNETLTIKRNETVVEEDEVNPVVETSKMRYTAATAVSDAQGKAQEGDDPGAVTVIANATAVVEVSPLSESEVIQAILEDLNNIRGVLEDQAKTTLERVALMQEVKDALAKQRSVGGSTASGATLETAAKKEVSKNATDQVLEGTRFESPPSPPPAPVPVPPVFEYSFDKEFLDITDEAVTLSAYLNLVVDNQPTPPLPMAVVFIVDDSIASSEDTLQTVVKFTEGFLGYVLSEINSNNSAIGLILNGDSGSSKHALTLLTKDSVTSLLSTVESANITSPGSYTEALDTAFGLLQSDEETRRKVVMPFIGKKSEMSKNTSFSEKVLESITASPVPIGVYPVLMGVESEGIRVANTIAEATGSNVVYLEELGDIEETLEEVRDLIVHVAAQNVSISASTGNEIEIVDVYGGNFVKSDSGDWAVSLLDLHFGDWRQLKFQLSLPPGSGNETLLSLSFHYFDVTAFSGTNKGPLSLEAFRASEEVFEAREKAREEVSETLGTAKDLLESNATDEAVVVIATAVAVVNVTLADDPIVQDLVNQLLAITSLLNSTLAADDEVQKDISEALDKVNDLEKKAQVPESDKDSDSASTDAAASQDTLAQSPLSVIIDPERLDLTTEAQNVSITMRIQTTEATPDLVEGSYVVLLDASDGMSDEDLVLATDMLVDFVRSLARRQGKRSIDILIFGEEVHELVSEDNVDFSNVQSIVDIINDRETVSGFDLEGAVSAAIDAADGSPKGRSLLQATSQLPEPTVLICVLGGNRTFVEADLEATLTTAVNALGSAQNVMTLFPILVGENSLGNELIGGLAYAADGEPYNVGSSGDIDGIVEKIGGWFESIAVQDFNLVSAPLSGSQILEFSGPVFSTDAADGKKAVSVPYLFFNEDRQINISVSVPGAINTAPVLSFSGSYMFAGSQNQFGPIRVLSDRTNPTTMKAKSGLLDKIKDKASEAGQKLVENQGEESVVVISSASAMTEASAAKDDPLVKDINEKLKGVEEVLKYALEDGSEDEHALQDAADALSEVEEQALRAGHQPSTASRSDDSSDDADREKGLLMSVIPEFKEYSSDEDTAYANITIQAVEDLVLVNNPAVTLVVDMTSGLSEGLLALVKDTAKRIVTSLREIENDVQLGVIVYGDGARIEVEMGPLTEETDDGVFSRIDVLEAAGDAELLEGITLGLEQQSGVSGRWQRSIAVISASAAAANQTDQEILDKATSLQSGPQNPVSIFSFAASFSNASVDLLGELATAAGGQLFILSNEDEVAASGEAFVESLVQSSIEDLTIEIRPEGFGRLREVVGDAASISDDGIPLMVKIPSLSPGENISLQATLDIALVNGSADVMSVYGEYFSRSLFQSVTLAPRKLTINKVDTQVLEERNRVRMEAADGLSTAQENLSAGNASSAEDALIEAKDAMKVARYQDDPVISAARRDVTDVLNSLQGTISNKTFDAIDLLLSTFGEESNSVGVEPFVKVVRQTISGISQAARKSLANSGRSNSANLIFVAICICVSMWLW